MDTLDEVVHAIQKAQAVDRVNKKETESFRLFLHQTSVEDLARFCDDVPSGAQRRLDFFNQKLRWPPLVPDYADTVDASMKRCRDWQIASESAGQKGTHTATFFVAESKKESDDLLAPDGRAEVFQKLFNEAERSRVSRQVLNENCYHMEDAWTSFDRACAATQDEVAAARQENLAHGDGTQRELETICSTANEDENDYATAVKNERAIWLSLDKILRKVQEHLRALEGAVRATADAELSVMVSRTLVPHAQARLLHEIKAVEEREKKLLERVEGLQAWRTQGRAQHNTDRQQIDHAADNLRLAEYEKLCQADCLAVATLSESVREVELAKMTRDKYQRELDASRRTLSRVTPGDWAAKTQVTKEITNLLQEEQNAENSLEALESVRKVWEDNCLIATRRKNGLEQSLFSCDSGPGFSGAFETVEKEAQKWVEQLFPPVDTRAIQVLREFDQQEVASDDTLHVIARELRRLQNCVQDMESKALPKTPRGEGQFDALPGTQRHVTEDKLDEDSLKDGAQTYVAPQIGKEDEAGSAKDCEPLSESDEPGSESEDHMRILGKAEEATESAITETKAAAEKKKIEDFLKKYEFASVDELKPVKERKLFSLRGKEVERQISVLEVAVRENNAEVVDILLRKHDVEPKQTVLELARRLNKFGSHLLVIMALERAMETMKNRLIVFGG